MNFSRELDYLQSQIQKAYYQINILKTIAVGSEDTSPYFSGELDKLVYGLETMVLKSRHLCEVCYKGIQLFVTEGTGYEKHWVKNTPCGKVEVNENGWLHITLDTLLPHRKKRSDPFLRDTLAKLLHGYIQEVGQLPKYERAMLIINEHCDIESRRPFDQDNKSWKIIPNVLKGLVIKDDDQFSLGIALISTWDSIPACHIYVMDMVDAGAYFSLYLGDSGTYFNQ